MTTYNRIRSYVPRSAGATALLAFTALLPASAQLPGLPTLQNAFANPGFTIAGDAGFGDGGSSFVLAGAWAPASGRVQISGGAGLYTPDRSSARGAWGLRASSAFLSALDGALGFGAFIGVGGAGGGGVDEDVPPEESPGGEAVSMIPVGLMLGYRHRLGARQGISAYVAPMFTWFSRGGANDESASLFRFSVGVDFAITHFLGLTAGVEFGQSADPFSLGPRHATFGFGVSYAIAPR